MIRSLTLAAALLALSSTAFAQTAQQQQKQACNDVTAQAKPADGGYKLVGIRRPKVLVNEQRVTEMALQVAVSADVVRTDAGKDDPKITKIFDCKGNRLGYLTGLMVKVVQEPDHDATEIVLPENTQKGTKFQTCSAAAGCFSGVFDEFGSWVNLQPIDAKAKAATAAASKIVGQYK